MKFLRSNVIGGGSADIGGGSESTKLYDGD